MLDTNINTDREVKTRVEYNCTIVPASGLETVPKFFVVVLIGTLITYWNYIAEGITKINSDIDKS